MSNKKAYLSFFRIRFINGLQYRAAAWAGAVTQFAWGAMTILMYRAFYQSGGNVFPMTFQEITSYIWLQESFLVLLADWSYDKDIIESISSGNIAYELCRPADIYTLWFTKNLATRYSKVVLRCLPIIIISFILPKPFGLSLPVSPAAGVLFIVSLTLGTLVLSAFWMLIYISTFYTISSLGIRNVASSIIIFLSGGVIPLPFFPDKIRDVLYLLPFAATQNTPLQIYSGFISGTQIYKSVLLQILWLIILLAVGRLWISRSLKKVAVQGG